MISRSLSLSRYFCNLVRISFFHRVLSEASHAKSYEICTWGPSSAVLTSQYSSIQKAFLRCHSHVAYKVSEIGEQAKQETEKEVSNLPTLYPSKSVRPLHFATHGAARLAAINRSFSRSFTRHKSFHNESSTTHVA